MTTGGRQDTPTAVGSRSRVQLQQDEDGGVGATRVREAVGKPWLKKENKEEEEKGVGALCPLWAKKKKAREKNRWEKERDMYAVVRS